MNSQPSASTKVLSLLMTYQQQPSVEIQDQLIRLNAGLVRKVVYRLCQQCNQPLSALESLGYEGLKQAIETFQPNQGLEFCAFALPLIRAKILTHGCPVASEGSSEKNMVHCSRDRVSQSWSLINVLLKILTFSPLLRA